MAVTCRGRRGRRGEFWLVSPSLLTTTSEWAVSKSLPQSDRGSLLGGRSADRWRLAKQRQFVLRHFAGARMARYSQGAVGSLPRFSQVLVGPGGEQKRRAF